jgi:integrase
VPKGRSERAFSRLKRDQEPSSPFVFTSERGPPFTTAGWRKMVARLSVAARLGFKAHKHMFRHACGFQLANQGTDTRTLQAYLGHRTIEHTVRLPSCCPRASRTSGATDDISAMTAGHRRARGCFWDRQHRGGPPRLC